MATYTPPPYFPQGSLAPPNENRYRKFRFFVFLAALLLLAAIAGVGVGVWYLAKLLF